MSNKKWSNPYDNGLGVNPYEDWNAPDTVLSGNRHAWDYYTQLYDKYLDFEAAMQMAQYSNEYNSPANQVRLMRQAGLNPDLAGVDFESMSAPDAPSRAMEHSNRIDPMAVASSVGKMIGQGADIISRIYGIRNLSAQNDYIQTQTIGQLEQVADRMSRGAWSPDGINAPTVDFFSGAKSGQMSQFLQEQTSRYASNPSLGDARGYEGLSQGEMARQLYNQVYSRIVGNKQLGGLSNSGQRDAFSYLSALEWQTTELMLTKDINYNRYISDYYAKKDSSKVADSENAQAGYTLDYYTELDGGLNAAAENSADAFDINLQRERNDREVWRFLTEAELQELANEIYMAEFDSVIKGYYKDTIKQLRQKVDDGTADAETMELLYYIGEAASYPNENIIRYIHRQLMNVGHSAAQSLRDIFE